MAQRQQPDPHTRATAASAAAATDGRARSLWFDPPTPDQDRRPRLTRERVVTTPVLRNNSRSDRHPLGHDVSSMPLIERNEPVQILRISLHPLVGGDKRQKR